MSGTFRPISTEYPISFKHRIEINPKSKLNLWPWDLNNFTLYKITSFLLEIILELQRDCHEFVQSSNCKATEASPSDIGCCRIEGELDDVLQSMNMVGPLRVERENG